MLFLLHVYYNALLIHLRVQATFSHMHNKTNTQSRAMPLKRPAKSHGISDIGIVLILCLRYQGTLKFLKKVDFYFLKFSDKIQNK